MAPSTPLSSTDVIDHRSTGLLRKDRVFWDNTVLPPKEAYWRDRCGFLASRGYRLRPRYQPDWKPSWLSLKNPSDGKYLCEDWYILPPVSGHIDAIAPNGQTVWLKAVPTSSDELDIVTFFSEPARRSDPRNHCVPILDSFEDALDKDTTIIVMPYLRQCNDPSFYYVGEVVDFVDQILQGLAYMHENNVAHRYCHLSRIRMDATHLYPHGHHPVLTRSSLDVRKTVQPYKRLESSTPVKYYLTSFRRSLRYTPKDTPLVLNTRGTDYLVPERSKTTPYDPFKADVYVLGHSLLTELYNKYDRLYFLRPLLDRMLAHEPESRVTSVEALRLWRDIRRRLTPIEFIFRLSPKDESLEATIATDAYAAVRLGAICLTGVIGKAASGMHGLVRGTPHYKA